MVQSEGRRNAENLAEPIPESARGMQGFPTDSSCEDDTVTERLRDNLTPKLEHSDEVLVLDRSDSPKQGRKSARFARRTLAVWARCPTATQECSWPM